MTLTARTIKVGSLTAAGTSGAATDALGSSATLDLSLGGQGALAVISGTWTATLQFEAKGAGGTWVAVPAAAITGGASATSTTANGNFVILAIGAIQVRVRCSAFTSGPAVVELSSIPVGGFNVAVTGGTGASAQPVQGAAADGGTLSNPLLIAARNASAGTVQQLYSRVPSTDAETPSNIAALYTASILYGFDATSLIRLRTAKTDGSALGTVGALAGAMHGWDGAGYSAAKVESAAQPNLRVGLYNGAVLATIGTAGDGASLGSRLATSSAMQASNNTNADLWHNNHPVTLYASSARTGTPTVAPITNYNGGGFVIFVDVTTGAATPIVTPSLQMVDSVGAVPKTIWTAAATITSTTAAQFAYMFHPGHATAAGGMTEALQMAMSRSMQLTMAHTDADSITYSVTVHFLAQ